MGDQLHISISACISGWREGLSLGVGGGGLRMVGGGAVLHSVVAPHTMASSCVSPWSCVHPRQSPVPWTVLRHCRLPRDQGGAVWRQTWFQLCQSQIPRTHTERWLMKRCCCFYTLLLVLVYSLPRQGGSVW